MHTYGIYNSAVSATRYLWNPYGIYRPMASTLFLRDIYAIYNSLWALWPLPEFPGFADAAPFIAPSNMKVPTV
jgi:hypothetical protein